MTVKPLCSTSQRTHSATALGVDARTRLFTTPYEPKVPWIGSAITAATRASPARAPASGTYSACWASASKRITGSKAASTNRWIAGTDRKLVDHELSLHALVNGGIRPAKPIDRLLRVPDEEELPRAWAIRRRIRSEGEKDVRLHEIGVLKLVDEDAIEAALKLAARARIVAKHVARAKEQVVEVERPNRRLFLLVASHDDVELVPEQAREIAARAELEADEASMQSVELGEQIRTREAGSELSGRPLFSAEIAVFSEMNQFRFDGVDVR